MSEVIMVMGSPASGKGTFVSDLILTNHGGMQSDNKNWLYLNRDKKGGKVIDLLPQMVSAIQDGKSVILDNTYPTEKSREPFIKAAKDAGAEIRCFFIATPAEDAQINELHRMWDTYQKIFFTQEDLKEVKGNPNMFPPSVIFKYRKELQKPVKSEGFDRIDYIKLERIKWWERMGITAPEKLSKALILDYDGTLRVTKEGSPRPYPVDPDQVEIMDNRTEVLKRLEKAGYILLGVSNQSGVNKGHLSLETADKCFDRTNELLGVDIDYRYCPHGTPPKCYCRKPLSGIAVALIRGYNLDPSECIFVGDYKTDKTFAKRAGFQYFDEKEFFKS